MPAAGKVFLAWVHVTAAGCALSAAYHVRVSCPNIVSRSEWGARDPVGHIAPLAVSPAPFVVIHHGGTKTYCHTQDECARIARSYQNYHMDSHGWQDIGYNFLVGEDGNVYEGRGWDATGAHAPPYNNQSVGVCVIGDFSDRLPNEAALRAVSELVRCGVQHGAVSKTYGLLGHRQARPTLCPGEAFYREVVVAMPHWVPHPAPIVAPAAGQDNSTSPPPSVNCI